MDEAKLTVHKGRKNPIRQCWTCGKRSRKYMQGHHVVTIREDSDMTAWLCRGCHWLVGLLSRRKFLADPNKVADLITLARMQAGLPNVKTVVRYEEV